MAQFSFIFGAALLAFCAKVNCAPTPEVAPGGALQQTTYCANYTSDGSNTPCASISGQHIVTQHCQESSLTEALQQFLKTVCTVVNAAANGPDRKKLDVCVTSNMTYVPPTESGKSDEQVPQPPVPTTISEEQQPPPPPSASSKADQHDEHEDEEADAETGRTEEEEDH